MKERHPTPEVARTIERRRFLTTAAAGTIVLALGGGSYVLASGDPREQQRRPDGRTRVPPGQRVINAIKPMGGSPGDPNPAHWSLRVHGEVDSPFSLTFAELLAMTQADQVCDVHCVTGWSLLDARFTGVRVADLAEKAGVRGSARHVIFEAAQGYTANVRIAEALAPSVLVAHRLDGRPLPHANGPPARALVPDLYFWKSAKWLTGIRFAQRDEPGYWETRGYHNHADPWKEERYG